MPTLPGLSLEEVTERPVDGVSLLEGRPRLPAEVVYVSRV